MYFYHDSKRTKKIYDITSCSLLNSLIFCIFTFPDPIDPITASNRSGLMVKFIFSNVLLFWLSVHFAVAFKITIPLS